MNLLIQVLNGPHSGARFELDRAGAVLVGRDSSAHMSLPLAPLFSRHHFLLEFNPPACHLRDLRSRAGTQVNGTAVGVVELRDGDTITCGSTSLGVTMGAASARQLVCRSCGQPSADPTLSWHLVDQRAQDYICIACRKPLTDNNGQAVPGYQLIRRVGQGGMGVVYMAQHAATGRIVAVKTILPECAVGDSAVQLFLREASVLSQLDHRRIVRFL